MAELINDGESAASVREKLNEYADEINTVANELLSKQDLDIALTEISNLSPGANDSLRFVGGVWTNRTPTQDRVTLSINNTNNTSDSDKPVSTAQQAALDLKQDEDAVDTTLWRILDAGDVDVSLTAASPTNDYIFFTNTTAKVVNIPTNASQAITVGRKYKVINLLTSVDDVTLTPAGGVTLHFINGGTGPIAPGAGVDLDKVATDTWIATY